jgi:hypothetical protein
VIGATPPALRFVFTITALVPDATNFIPLEGRSGEQLDFIPITGGTVEGEISGHIIPGGGDWCLTRSDEAYNVEARYLFRTSEGEVVDVVNVGVLRHLTDPDNSQVDMGYFLTTPRFRTTSARLQWLTRSVFVGRAQSLPSKTVIDVYEVLQ